MLSGYLERVLNYVKSSSNNSRKRNSQGMTTDYDEVDYIPVHKRLRTSYQDSEGYQSSTWISTNFNKVKNFFSHAVESVTSKNSRNNRHPNMESSRKKRDWAVKNSHKSITKPSTLTRGPLKQNQPQYYNPFVSSSSNVHLPEIINIEDDSDEDEHCVKLPSSEQLFIPNYEKICNSEEENFYPAKRKESRKKKSSFLSLAPSDSQRIQKRSKLKSKKGRHLFYPTMMLPSTGESFRQDEKEKYQLLMEQYATTAASFSSFQEADLKLSPKLAHQKSVSVQTAKNAPKSNAFFKVNLTDSDKMSQIKNIEGKRPLKAIPWDKKVRANEHVFQIPYSSDPLRVGLPSKLSSKLPSDQSRRSFSVLQDSSYLRKSRSTESLTHPLKPNLRQSLYDQTKAAVFSDSQIPTAKHQYSVKSLERKSLPRSVYDQELFSKKWLDQLKDNVEKSSRTQSEKAEHEEFRYQMLQEEKLAKQFETNRKNIANISSKFSVTVSTKYDESDDEDSYQLPNLTTEMQTEIDNALRPNPPDEVLVQSFGIKITRKDMETLAGLNWLNDEVINFYMNLLMERGTNDNYPSCYAFNTFFYPKLINSGHGALKRWTRKIDIFAHDLILIPVHLGMHWCLAVIDFRHKKIQYYDSMGGQNNECLNALRTYLHDECMDKKKVPYNTSDWKLETVKNIPQQMNGSDCGMFACKFAEYITRNAKILFSQKDMPHFRRLMVYEIIKRKLT